MFIRCIKNSKEVSLLLAAYRDFYLDLIITTFLLPTIAHTKK